ncbi:hypothetical protein DFQ04_3526 [Algoriphagus boseongensis]|uniref:Uncharacterized protein n=1 Tax=Algoriphagus boseongensis TaxID=1442587 RepID=A0A4R6T179_9BACT|nr:hypothetical protein DFQ04_3526 [Algoriphagus boseongensis]
MLLLKSVKFAVQKLMLTTPNNRKSTLPLRRFLNQKPAFTKTKNYEAKFTQKLGDNDLPSA